MKLNKQIKKSTRTELQGFHFIEKTSGVILDGIWIKDDGSELIIRSAFFSERYLHFRPLEKGEKSL